MTNNSSEKQGQLISLNTSVATEKPVKRPRAMTTLKLQWLAERLRKAERIKLAVAAGTYSVDSTLVAKAILGIEDLNNENEDSE